MASTDLPTFRRFIFESSFLETYELDEETIKKIKEDDVELMLFSFEYLAATLFGATKMNIKEEKIKEKVARMKEEQDASVLKSVKEYEEFKAQAEKEKKETGIK